MKRILVYIVFILSFPWGVDAQSVPTGQSAYIGSFAIPKKHGICAWGQDPFVGTKDIVHLGGNPGVFTYQLSGDSMRVYFEANSPGDYFDSTLIELTYYCTSDSRFNQDGSLVHVARATAVADSQIRIRPNNWAVSMYFDSIQSIWVGSARARFANDSSVDCVLSDFHLQLDSVSSKKMQLVVEDSGVPIQTKLLKAGTSDTNISLRFTSSLGIAWDTYVTLSSALLTTVHTPGKDSVFTNPIDFTLWTPQLNFTMSVRNGDTIRLSSNSMVASQEKFFTVKCDPRLNVFTVSRANYPFHIRIADSTRDSIRIGISIEPTTGAIYGDTISVNWDISDFQGTHGRHQGWAREYIIAHVDRNGETPFWEPAGFTNNINPSGFLYKGDAIYAWNPGLYRLRHSAADWETILDGSHGLQKLIKSKTGHLVALGNQWSRSTDDGISWTSIHTDDFGSLGWTDFHGQSQGAHLPTVGPEYGPDCKLYLAGSLQQQSYVQATPHWVSRSRVASIPDSGGTWSSIIDDYSKMYQFCGTLTDSSARVLMCSGPSIDTEIFGALPPGDAVSFYPNGDYFSGFINGGLCSSYGAHGLPLCGFAGTAIAPNGDLYAVGGEGVFRSTDSGQTWHGLNAGLDTIRSNKIVIDPHGHIYLRNQTGWYRSIESVDAVRSRQTTTNTNRIELYPNPANTSITVISEDAIASIKLLDCTGRTLSFNSVSSNETSYNIGTAALPSGLYVMQVQTEQGTLTAKVSVIH